MDDEEYEEQYYILIDLKPVLASFPEFVNFCEQNLQVIDETWINSTVRVITVFTGVDQGEPPGEIQPPLLFETMVVGTKLPIAEAYTSNLGDAKAFHYDRVFELRKLYSSNEEIDA